MDYDAEEIAICHALKNDFAVGFLASDGTMTTAYPLCSGILSGTSLTVALKLYGSVIKQNGQATKAIYVSLPVGYTEPLLILSNIQSWKLSDEEVPIIVIACAENEITMSTYDQNLNLISTATANPTFYCKLRDLEQQGPWNVGEIETWLINGIVNPGEIYTQS